MKLVRFCFIKRTLENSEFYIKFTGALRSRDQDSNEVRCFYPFLQLLLLAMHKLPKGKGDLFRGERNVPMSVIKEYKKKAKKKKCVFWRACSDTKKKIETLSNPMLSGNVGNRTRFVIHGCEVGVDMGALLGLQWEGEVLLPPCLRFQVEEYIDLGNGLIEIWLSYSAPRCEILQLVPPPHFLSSPVKKAR